MGEGTESEEQGIINFAMLPQGCAHSCTDENSCRSAVFSVFSQTLECCVSVRGRIGPRHCFAVCTPTARSSALHRALMLCCTAG